MTAPSGVIAVFLPGVDPSTGPFGLLGLEPGAVGAGDVEAALGRRLREVDAHPRGGSSEAGDVRGALHVAAAQLRDVGVRDAILAELRSRAGEPVGDVAAEVGRRAAPSPVSVPVGAASVAGGGAGAGGVASRVGGGATFHDAARHALARAGGWNAEGKRMLAALAAGEGVDAGVLRGVLVDINRGEASRAGFGGGVEVGVRGEDGLESGVRVRGAAVDAPPASSGLRVWMNVSTVVLLCLSGVMLVTLASVVIARAASGLVDGAGGSGVDARLAGEPDEGVGDGAGLAGVGVVGGDGEVITATEAGALGAAGGAERFASADEGDLFRALRGLDREAIGSEPGVGLGVFRDAVRRFAVAWVGYSGGGVSGIGVPVRDALIAAGRVDGELGASFAREIVALAADYEGALSGGGAIGGDAIARRVFASALAGEVAGDLDEETRLVLGALELGSGGVAGMWGGLSRALEAVGEVMTGRLGRPGVGADSGDDWAGWARCAEAVIVAAPVEGAGLVLDVLEGVLRSGVDARGDEVAAGALAALAAVVPWDDGASLEGRRRLVGWFGDAGVETGALAALVEVLIGSGLVEGLAGEHRLADDADPSERTRVGSMVAAALGVGSDGERDAFVLAWRAEAGALFGDADGGSGVGVGSVALRAAALASLNEAAAMVWSGGVAAAEGALDRASALRARASFVGGEAVDDRFVERRAVGGDRLDGDWAAEMLNARQDREARVVLLNQLRNDGGPIGLVDGAVLAETAMYSLPRSIRSLAQRVVVELRDEAMVVSGLIEACPDAASDPGVVEMLEAVTGRGLPGIGEASWRVAARGALIGRLVDMEGASRHAALNDAAESMAASYAVRAGVVDVSGGDAGSGGGAALGGDAALASEALYASWRGIAGRYAEPAESFASLAEIERRHGVRVGMAEGPLQRFAASQASALEVMAWVVQVRRPGEASRVREVVAGLSRRVREAPTALHQALAVERAFAELWSLRLAGGDG